jgi:hypothetical protein
MLSATRLHLRRLSTIAFLAVFGLVFAPTISRALAHASPAWAEVCTAQGRLQIDLSGAERELPAPQSSIAHLDHCPLCGLGATAILLPPAAPALPASSRLSEALPALFLQAPHTLFAWHQAQPRAPPKHS